MKFIVYEIWTKAHIIDAASPEDAVMLSEPDPSTVDPSMYLSNVHVIQVPTEDLGSLKFQEE